MEFKDVEAAHQLYKKKVKKIVAISVVVAVVLIIVFIASSRLDSMFDIISSFSIVMFILIVFAIIISFFMVGKESKAYKAAYKTYFVEKGLRQTFTDLQYSHELGLKKEVLQATQMIYTGDVYGSNDYVTGKYKDVGFSQADVHIQEKHTDSDGNTTYVTIFMGRFMIFEFPKKFTFRLEVVEKGFGGACRVPGKNPQTGRKFEKIQVESNEFNNAFKIYAEDGFEAFYILDPAFINNVLGLNDEYKGKIFLGFLDNKLIVGLRDGKDAFEPPNVFKELNEQAETEKIAKDIHLITNFVDTLKLNKKLFK